MAYFDADGEAVDIDTLEIGTLVQDEDGQVCQVTDDAGTGLDPADFDDASVEQGELVGVGKSAFFDRTPAQAGSDLLASLSKSLESAIADDGQRQAIAKAFADQQVALVQAQQTAQQAMGIAKGLADAQEEAQFVELAKGYDTPVAPDVLGPVLHRMTKSMSYDDCAIIAGLLENTTDIFKSAGVSGDGGILDPNDPTAEVSAFLAAQAAAGTEIVKSSTGTSVPVTGLSKEAGTVAFFDSNPTEYSRLKRNR